MSPSLAALQQRFADSLRNPEAKSDGEFNPDLRREKIYRELIFNNLDNLLAGTFPVLHATLDNTLWKNLIRRFLRDYRAQTPLFPELPEEFLNFLQNAQLPKSAPGWLTELAHYEWIELGLQLQDPSVSASNITNDSALLLSPLAIPLIYRYPVHRINPDFLPGETDDIKPTYLLAYRRFNHEENRFEEDVQFMVLSEAAMRLLLLIRDGINGDMLANKLSEELQIPVDNVRTFSQNFIDEMIGKGIIFIGQR